MVHFNKLSDDLHQRLLGWHPQEVPKRVIREAEDRYKRFNLDKAKDTNPIVNLPLPEWMGTWEECINEAVDIYGKPHLDRLEKLALMDTPMLPDLRPMSRPGWQMCEFGEWSIVDKPTDLLDCAVIDFETVCIDGFWYPFCAVLLSCSGIFYVWRADLKKGKWIGDEWVPTYDRTLDSLPTGVTWVGHNSPYDRQYIGQEYQLKDTGNRFFDTMAAFIACRGLSNQQRVAYKAMSDDDCPAEWVNETATNGLSAVHKFYFGTSLDKGIRDELVNGGLPFVLANFDSLVWYCLEDVVATLNVFKSVYGELKHYQPHPASWSGQLLLGSSWLPLSKDRYPGYYDRVEAQYRETEKEIKSALLKVATFVASTPVEQIEADPWLSQLDWTLGKLELKPDILKTLISLSDDKLTNFSEAIVLSKSSPKRWLKAPAWYRDFIKKPSIKKNIVPLFLQVKYLGKPVLWLEDTWATADGALPHPEKKGQRVTTLFSKGYTKLWEAGALESSLEGTKDLVSALVSTINWVSFRERAKAIHTEEPNGYPVVLPQLTVSGTITRRAADNVFQVLANPKEKRLGTEFKSMIEAIPGYLLVGADVASQEAWICGLFGDSVYGYNGATAFGYMNLVGTKKDRTEVHTLFADLLDMKRDDVKVVNYGCVPLDTEALTKEGWKSYKELSVGTEIMAYDPDRNMLTWQPIQHLTYHAVAETLRLKHKKGFSVVTTPDHRWYTTRRNFARNGYNLRVKTTATLNGEDNLITAAKAEGGGSSLSPREASILAWLITDGSVVWSKTGYGVHATISQKKAPYCATIATLLGENGKECKSRGDGLRTWYLGVDYVRYLWAKAGLVPNKEDYVKMVLGLSQEARAAFLESCFQAEGHVVRGVKYITQNEGAELEAMQCAASLEGYRPIKQFKEVTVSGKNCYRLILSTCGLTGQKLEKEKTEAMAVYCPTVASKAWLMRQKDVITITGNCIYGMSVTGAANAIQKAVPTLTPAEAKGKAEKHIALFKGTRHPESYRWIGGLASESFNWMEALVKGREPRSPVLGAMLSAALRTTGRDYMTTKVNWTVQTSGVDFRDMLILLTRYFFDKLGVDGRFLMTIHDEIRTMVREDQVKLAAYALQLAHVCIRSAFIDKLGMDSIPMGIAWFPAIDVDRYLRKEPDMTCVTPSQPVPLEPGYLLTPADLLDISI